MPFIYPTSFEMRTLLPVLEQRDRASRLGLRIMPIRRVNAAKVRWRQRDNSWGLQHLRGLDGVPTLVTRVGEKSFEYTPGVFGEYEMVTETELTERSGSVDVRTTVIDVGDLVAECDDQLIQREDDRIESSNWAVLTTGTISIKIAGPNGQQVGYTSTYTIQTFTAAVAWATIATATPLKDFQTVSLLGVGKGVNFGAGANAYMNSVTGNNMLNNTNANDLAGRRAEMGSTIDNIPEVNRFLVGRASPPITLYDQGYPSDAAGTYTKFIPDNKVVVVGQKPGAASVGYYVITRNANANYQPVSYRFVLDFANGGGAGGGNAPKKVPPHIEVHRGHNGGPTMEYPSAVVLMNV
jgi:hypothetical protein